MRGEGPLTTPSRRRNIHSHWRCSYSSRHVPRVPALRAADAPLAGRPNIVVILSDDYGYGSAGCCGADGKLVQTPHIDRLAREGRRFTDANTTSSVCSPTRYSVLTGRYCWRTSLTHEVLGVLSPLHIEPDRLNLAALLKRHGVRGRGGVPEAGGCQMTGWDGDRGGTRRDAEEE